MGEVTVGSRVPRDRMVLPRDRTVGRSPRDRRGSMLMEFVLTMPILLMLIMLILQFAQIMVVRQFVAYAAFCSTRSMLCSNPSEWMAKNSKNNCAFQAARRALAWVTIFGTPESANLRSWDEGYLSVDASDFSDVVYDPISYATTIYGSKGTRDVLVPGWGQISESNSVDKRLDVSPGITPGRCAWSTIKYKFPLLIPIAGQMIGFFTKHSAEESTYVKSNSLMPGWVDQLAEDEMLDGVPYIELTETCVLPLPYSTANLPGNPFGVGSAFDYTSYD